MENPDYLVLDFTIKRGNAVRIYRCYRCGWYCSVCNNKRGCCLAQENR